MNSLEDYKIGDVLRIEERFIGIVIRGDSDYFAEGFGEFIFDGKMILLLSDIISHVPVLEVAVGYYQYFAHGHVELLGNIRDMVKQ